jgi:ribosomal protein S18 acetylase RimI-like enzyme
VIELHYFGVAAGYQGQGCASDMFGEMERQARAHPKARPDMPIVLEVEVGNTHAREIYDRWDFVYLGPRTAEGTDRHYEVLARSASEDEAPPDDEAPAAS